MEKLLIDVEWLTENGFREMADLYPGRYFLQTVDSKGTTVFYMPEKNFLNIDKWDDENDAHMCYMGRCISTVKLLKILEAFEIKVRTE